MKVSPSRKKAADGSVLFIAIMAALLIAIVLASYLTLVSNRSSLSHRSLAWNSAVPVAEAGIEEALTHLNVDKNAPTTNGWSSNSVSGQTVYWKRREFADGSYVCVTNFNVTSTTPSVYARGFAPSPLRPGEYISRLLCATATNPPNLFNKSVAANGVVTLSGGAVVDAYDSSLGPYNTTNNRSANGGIATNFRGLQGIKVGTAHVYGTVATGAGGTVSISGGAVGDVSWNTSNTGIEPGYSTTDMNVAFPTNQPPSGGPWLAPPVISAGGSNITSLAISGTNQMDSFTSSDSTKPMIVTGNCTLYVTGDFTVSGSGYVYIAPGASLTVIVGGKFVVSGGGVVNATQSPSKFSFIGLSTCNTCTYSGSASFIGTINAPQALVTVSGGADVYGAVIGNSFTSSGGSGVHYDSSLGGGKLLVLTSWREL
jgi:hypothetical protein